MIRVNLLSAQGLGATTRDSLDIGGDGEVSGFDQKVLQRQALVNIFIIAFLPLCLYIVEQQTVPPKKARVAQLTIDIAELAAYNGKNAASVNEIKKFESDRDQIVKQIEFLESISQARVRDIMVLDLLQQIIPEKTWLQKVSIDSAENPASANPKASLESLRVVKKLMISGYSLADAEVSDFTERLQKSALLENVINRRTADKALDATTVKEFLIEGKLVSR
ncbi:MAG: PilN domain-containing protein [Bdellovibrionota bacterium]